ncbi:pilus assembly FimT family protein [Levilactobacillus yonginensis]
MVKRQGFTLYEMLLVLAIVTSLTTLVGFQSSRRTNMAAEQAFWPAWQRVWQAGRQQAIQLKQPLRLSVDQKTGTTTLRVIRSGKLLNQLRPPATLKWRGGESSWQLLPHRGTAPRLVEWYSTTYRCWWYQTIQLGGNLIHVESAQQRRSSGLSPA